MRHSLRIVIATTIALTGCNALLDVKDIYFDPNAGEGGAPDGSGVGDGGAPSPEGSVVTEAGVEGGPCDAAALTTDRLNCGRCGHDCFGGNCIGGVCQALVLASGLGGPAGIAVDATTVYVTMNDTGTVAAYPKNGGAVTSLAANEVRARGVAVNGATLFWANGDFPFDDAGAKGGIWKCTLPGCMNKTLVTASAYGTSYPVIHGGFLYYDTGDDGTVARVSLEGGAGAAIATTNHPLGLAVDDVYAYYSSAQPTLYRAHIDGTSVGMEEALGADNGSTTTSRPGFVVIDADRLYWAYTDDASKGHVLSASKSAPTAGSILYGSAADNVSPVGIAVDADNLYWSTDGNSASPGVPVGDGKVFACPKLGCPPAGPTVLATGNVYSGPMTVDKDAVYWTEYGATGGGSGRVRKVAKP